MFLKSINRKTYGVEWYSIVSSIENVAMHMNKNVVFDVSSTFVSQENT